jgi:hypothetical protein
LDQAALQSWSSPGALCPWAPRLGTDSEARSTPDI